MLMHIFENTVFKKPFIQLQEKEIKCCASICRRIGFIVHRPFVHLILNEFFSQIKSCSKKSSDVYRYSNSKYSFGDFKTETRNLCPESCNDTVRKWKIQKVLLWERLQRRYWKRIFRLWYFYVKKATLWYIIGYFPM